MLKDTKSLGNNKTPACESRGFVRKKKEGVPFDTPSFFVFQEIFIPTCLRPSQIFSYNTIVPYIKLQLDYYLSLDLW